MEETNEKTNKQHTFCWFGSAFWITESECLAALNHKCHVIPSRIPTISKVFELKSSTTFKKVNDFWIIIMIWHEQNNYTISHPNTYYLHLFTCHSLQHFNQHPPGWGMCPSPDWDLCTSAAICRESSIKSRFFLGDISYVNGNHLPKLIKNRSKLMNGRLNISKHQQNLWSL